MKKQLLFPVLLLLHLAANGQTNGKKAVDAKNAVYFTFLGESGLSVHYNRMLFEKGKFFVDGKIGAGILPGISLGSLGSSPGAFTASHSFSANFGVQHCIEAGLGGNYGHSFEEGEGYGKYKLYPIIGYKFRSANSRFVFRLTAHPYLTPAPHDLDVAFPVGITFGFSF